jgi:hypothetical protein
VASHRVFYPLLPFFARKQKIFFVSLASDGNKNPPIRAVFLTKKRELGIVASLQNSLKGADHELD